YFLFLLDHAAADFSLHHAGDAMDEPIDLYRGEATAPALLLQMSRGASSTSLPSPTQAGISDQSNRAARPAMAFLSSTASAREVNRSDSGRVPLLFMRCHPDVPSARRSAHVLLARALCRFLNFS